MELDSSLKFIINEICDLECLIEFLRGAISSYKMSGLDNLQGFPVLQHVMLLELKEGRG